jgi:hypothetical protein
VTFGGFLTGFEGEVMYYLYFLIKTALGVVMVLSCFWMGTEYFSSFIVGVILAVLGFIFWNVFYNND